VTGANLQVRGEDIQKQSTTTALQALQGQAPGVQITTYSGQPGSGMGVSGSPYENAPFATFQTLISNI
jgi:TonB-dependent starch-binding outer membrane protein SusC